MLNIFAISAQDQSLFYLSQLFGPVGGAIPAQSSASANLLLPVMFKVLNTIALTIGAVVITYVTFVGLMYTASEGSFLGQKWNKVWVPLRLVIGTISLFPAASGYSMLQVIIMWVIVQGIGAADTMWTAALNYIQNVGSPLGRVEGISTGVQPNIENLFKAASCQATARRQDKMFDSANIKYFCNGKTTDPFCSASSTDLYNIVNGKQTNNQSGSGMETATISYYFGPGAPTGSCGTLTYCNKTVTCAAKPQSCAGSSNEAVCKAKKGPDSLDCLTCTAQQQALQSIVPVLGAVADGLAQVDYEYIDFYVNYNPSADPEPPKPAQWILDFCAANNVPADQCCANGTLKTGNNETSCPSTFRSYDIKKGQDTTSPPDATVQSLYAPYGMKAFLGNSLDFIQAATNQYIQQAITAPLVSYYASLPASNLSGRFNETQRYGWITAGGYYFKLAKASRDNQGAAQPTFTVSAGAGIGTAGELMGSNRNNLTASGVLITSINTNLAASGLGSTFSSSEAVITDGMAGITRSFTSLLTEQRSDAVASIAQFGAVMMSIAQILFVVIVAIILYQTFFGTLNPIFAGTGLTMNPTGEAIKSIWSFLEPFIVGLIVTIFSLGAMCNIYVPLIPLILFSMTAIGWMIAVIEAMVAAPIMALGILGPGGQHEILGRAEPSMLILLNLFLRPTLMIFGLLTAMILSNVAIKMVNMGFANISRDMYLTGMFEQLVFIMAYITFIVTVLSKTFSLIHVIPEKILTYIGGPAIQYGEGEALGQVKGAVEGAAGGMAGAGKASAGSTASAAGAQKTAEKGAKEEEERNKGAAAAPAAPAPPPPSTDGKN